MARVAGEGPAERRGRRRHRPEVVGVDAVEDDRGLEAVVARGASRRCRWSTTRRAAARRARRAIAREEALAVAVVEERDPAKLEEGRQGKVVGLVDVDEVGASHEPEAARQHRQTLGELSKGPGSSKGTEREAIPIDVARGSHLDARDVAGDGAASAHDRHPVSRPAPAAAPGPTRRSRRRPPSWWSSGCSGRCASVVQAVGAAGRSRGRRGQLEYPGGASGVGVGRHDLAPGVLALAALGVFEGVSKRSGHVGDVSPAEVVAHVGREGSPEGRGCRGGRRLDPRPGIRRA